MRVLSGSLDGIESRDSVRRGYGPNNQILFRRDSMADARPTGKLTTGAIGNFLLGGAMALMVLSGAVGALTGGGGGEGAGILGLIAFLFIVGGGITGAIGWFGLGSLYGGTNVLAGVFAIIFAVVPIALIVLGTSGGMGGGMGMAKIIILLVFLVPGLLGLLGGLGVMKGNSGMAKPAGIVTLIGGIATAAVGVIIVFLPEMVLSSAGLISILIYVGFFGLAVGFFLVGAAMLGERTA